MIEKVIRQVSLAQSEDQRLSDWALYTPIELLAIGYQLKLQYIYAYGLSDRVDKTKVKISNFKTGKLITSKRSQKKIRKNVTFFKLPAYNHYKLMCNLDFVRWCFLKN